MVRDHAEHLPKIRPSRPIAARHSRPPSPVAESMNRADPDANPQNRIALSLIRRPGWVGPVIGAATIQQTLASKTRRRRRNPQSKPKALISLKRYGPTAKTIPPIIPPATLDVSALCRALCGPEHRDPTRFRA